VLWVALSFVILLSHPLTAEHFFPCSPEELESAIIRANINCEDDVIDLQCNQFDLTTSDNATPNNGSNGLPVITPDSGHKLKIKNGTISRSNAMGTPLFRFFEIQPTASLILEEITLENGAVSVAGSGLTTNGGQILNQGTLVLKDSALVGFIPDVTINPPPTIQENALLGGGIFNDTGAMATIKGSTFSNLGADSGGAIYNARQATFPEICSTRFLSCQASASGGAIYNQAGASINIIRRSIFDQNHTVNGSSEGGAIYNDGSSSPFASIGTISYTTLSNNSCSVSGGAIINYGDVSTMLANSFLRNSSAFGGGLFNVRNIGSISNSTFSENSTGSIGGGIYNALGATVRYLTNNTIANNEAIEGGGIFSDGVVLNWASNLIAKNHASVFGPDVFLGRQAIEGTPSYNLIGDGSSQCSSCSLCNVFSFANHNLVGNCNGLPVIDPLLESLANNGGPTLTMALRPLSPALGAGINPFPHELKFDQRGPGHPRTIDGSTDIGAFESCVNFDLDGDCDDDNCHCEDEDHDGECDHKHQQ